MTARELRASATAAVRRVGSNVLPPAPAPGPRVWQVGVYEVDTTGHARRRGSAERLVAGPVLLVDNDPQVVHRHVAAWATQERVRTGRCRVKAIPLPGGRSL